MPTQVNIPAIVQREIAQLKRKYPAVVKEVRQLVHQLEQDERPGDKISGVSHDVYKVRLANPSAQRGKSGGFRVVYYVKLAEVVVLVSVYSKTEQTDIPLSRLRQVLDELENVDDDLEE